MSRYQKDGALIFDFDGVLADTEEVAYQTLCRLARLKNIPEPSLEYLKYHRNQEVLALMRIRWWEIPFYLWRARRWAQEISPISPLFPWTETLIQTAFETTENVWIVSSNTPMTIKKALRAAKINHFPDSRICGNVGVFGKKNALRRVVRNQGLNPDYVGYVCDETRDIEAARHAGIKSVVVSWGYHHPEFLSSKDPDFILKKPEDFPKIAGLVLS